MAVAVPGILARIVDHKRAALAHQTSTRAALERKAADRRGVRDFRKALTTRSVTSCAPAMHEDAASAAPSSVDANFGAMRIMRISSLVVCGISWILE